MPYENKNSNDKHKHKAGNPLIWTLAFFALKHKPNTELKFDE